MVDEPVQSELVKICRCRLLVPHVAMAVPEPDERERHVSVGSDVPVQPSAHVKSGQVYCVKLPPAGVGGDGGFGPGGGGFAPTVDDEGRVVMRHSLEPYAR